MSKEEIRKQMIEKRNKLSEKFILKNSRIISEKLFGMDIYHKAESIYIYLDFNGEVSTREIIEDALSNDKKVALPKIINNEMEFYYIDNINDVYIGYFGIREPISNEVARAKEPLIIMPGVAFDRKGHRIGYGKGFYDRYLSKCNGGACSARKIALAFDFQVMEKIPFESYDVIQDIIITEKNIVYSYDMWYTYIIKLIYRKDE